MGRNVEVDIDDTLVKSSSTEDLIGYLEEIFFMLQRYELKLNPSKFIFGVRSGKFLDYLVTKR